MITLQIKFRVYFIIFNQLTQNYIYVDLKIYIYIYKEIKETSNYKFNLPFFFYQKKKKSFSTRIYLFFSLQKYFFSFKTHMWIMKKLKDI